MARFEGKVALVTGAGEGIGLELARQLAAEGAQVLLNDIDSARAEEAAAAICAGGGECRPLAGDAGDVEIIRRMVDTAVDAWGRLDIAVANAGLTLYGDFFDYEPATLELLLNLNLRGSFFLAQAAARQMRDQGDGGRILLTSSVTGLQAVRFLSAYGMTKAALRMLARNLVLELSPYNITINTIAPGAILTPRNLLDDPDFETSWGNLNPMKRVGTVEDVTAAALFLLSAQASHITGQTLVVDGGWSVTSPLPEITFRSEGESR